MDDYLTLVLTISTEAGNLISLITLMLLFFGRIFPIIMLCPWFGARVLPHPVKVALGLSLWVIFLPKLLEVNVELLYLSHWTLLLMAKELVVGLSIGMLMSIPNFIAQSAGMIIDHQRGGASLMTNDPAVQNQSSPMGTMFNYLTILIFYFIGGPFIFIETILLSYEIIPPDRLLHFSNFSFDSEFAQTFIHLFNKLMVISIQLASPGLLTIFMTDLFLGIANRLAPQVQITFLGMPLKSLLAMMVVCLGLFFIADQILLENQKFLQDVKQMVIRLVPG